MTDGNDTMAIHKSKNNHLTVNYINILTIFFLSLFKLNY